MATSGRRRGWLEVMTPTASRSTSPELSWAPLFGYVAVQAAIIVIAALVGGRPGAALDLLAQVLATVALGYGVLRFRPVPLAAWRFILASLVIQLATGISVIIIDQLEPTYDVRSKVPTTLGGLGQLALIIGLVLLSRGVVRRLMADLLDALMTAMALYLLLWVVLIEPALRSNAFPVVSAVTLPIVSLLVFTTGLRLVFGGGLRDPAIALVLLGTALQLLTFDIVIVPGLQSGSLLVGERVAILGSAYFAAFGAAGLHPALRRPRAPAPAPADETGRHRIALFVLLSLVLPFVGVAEVLERKLEEDRPLMLVVPVLLSGLFLLVVVTRLALAIRTAQRRANELARQTAALARSLSEQEALQGQLAYRALHDPLTGLANRTVLTDAIEGVLDDPRRSGRHALLLLDLDHFKDINDTLGHPVGDRLLVDVGWRLRALTPSGGILVRLGGDEFAVFVERFDTDAALTLAERLRTDLRRVYLIGDRELFVTTSVGVLTTPHQPAVRMTPADLLRDADLALYDAKAGGKDRVSLFHPGLRLARLDHARTSAGLRRALTNDEFVMHYQPIVDVNSGAVVAVEALVRWRTESGRLLPPSDFIPVAEDTGQVEPIGAWALRRSLKDDRRWFADHGVAVTVNVAARQLAQPDFASSVLACLHELDLPGGALIIEITESSLVGTAQVATRGHLDRLRAHGVRIAIDDFGTGYSSLSYVAQLPVDIVKVDKSFVQGLGPGGPDGQDWAFTRAILQMVASLDKLAIAEGVETADQAAAIRTLRCPLVQGFHYSRPVPAEVIDRALARSVTFAAPRA
jgi:diguanylate cyclase (GGDEF)-like protein